MNPHILRLKADYYETHLNLIGPRWCLWSWIFRIPQPKDELRAYIKKIRELASTIDESNE